MSPILETLTNYLNWKTVCNSCTIHEAGLVHKCYQFVGLNRQRKVNQEENQIQ